MRWQLRDWSSASLRPLPPVSTAVFVTTEVPSKWTTTHRHFITPTRSVRQLRWILHRPEKKQRTLPPYQGNHPDERCSNSSVCEVTVFVVHDRYPVITRHTALSSLWAYPEQLQHGLYWSFEFAITWDVTEVRVSEVKRPNIAKIPSQNTAQSTVRSWCGKITHLLWNRDYKRRFLLHTLLDEFRPRPFKKTLILSYYFKVRLVQCFSTFVRPRSSKFFFHKTWASFQQIYS